MTLLDDNRGQLLPVSAESVREWAKATDPPPSREDVVAYVQRQRGAGRLSDDEAGKLTLDYPELAGF